jgi:Fic family protein
MSQFLLARWTPREQLAIDGALPSLLEKLAELERRAAAQELRPNWDALNLARSYASHSLKADPGQMLRWQSANAAAAQALANKESLSFAMIENWNRVLLGSEDSPVVRTGDVSIAGRRLLAVAEVPRALEDFGEHVLRAPEEHAVVRASRIYQWLISIHPFTNANGRTARLAADYVLMEAGILPAVFPSPLSFAVALFPDRPRQVKPIEAFHGIVLAVERAAEILCL